MCVRVHPPSPSDMLVLPCQFKPGLNPFLVLCHRGGERLVGFIFQLLILLAQDSTCKQVTLPKVIQLCDTVIASDHAAALFGE